MSSVITDYLGSGPIADRPTTPDIPDGATAIWYATDTTVLYVWDGSAWDAPNAGITLEQARDAVGGIVSATGSVSLTYTDGTATQAGSIVAAVKPLAVLTTMLANAAVLATKIGLSDTTTNNFTSGRHGFTPKATTGTTKFLRTDGSWQIPAGQSSPAVGTFELITVTGNSLTKTISNTSNLIVLFATTSRSGLTLKMPASPTANQWLMIQALGVGTSNIFSAMTVTGNGKAMVKSDPTAGGFNTAGQVLMWAVYRGTTSTWYFTNCNGLI